MDSSSDPHQNVAAAPVKRKKRSAGRDLKAAIGVGIFLAAIVVVSLTTPVLWYPMVALSLIHI